MLELEIEIQEAKECLRNAQDELARESFKDSSQSISGSNRSRNRPIQDGKEVRHSRVSDENIRQAVCDLHCMITPGMTEKRRKRSKPARMRVHASAGIVRR